MKPTSCLLCLLLVVSCYGSSPARLGAIEPDGFSRSTQMIVVTTSEWNAVEGRLQRYERATGHGKWRSVGEPISIVVGKNGLGWGISVIATDDAKVRSTSNPVKREGDGKAPAGVFVLGTAFGYAAQPLQGSKMPYLYLKPSVECVDDVRSSHYNRVVDSSVVVPDWNSSEHMRNTGESYRLGIIVDHNGIVTGSNDNMPVPGGGSCIFLHIWGGSGQGTAGCTAMAQSDMTTLLLWLDPVHKPLLVQLPEPAYKRLVTSWMLPKLIHVPLH